MILNAINVFKSSFRDSETFCIHVQLQQKKQGRQSCVKTFAKGMDQEDVYKFFLELAEDIKNR